MGHNDRERRRLALQASILNPLTEQLFLRAGISSSMRVLDIGCGVGDLSVLAARLVGRHGEVTGIDIDESALAMAGKRAQEQGFNNVTFVHSDACVYRADRPFDAVVGRHILIHAPDPLSVVRAAFSALNPGGIAVFQEYDFSVLHPSYPESPLRDRIFGIFRDFFCTATHGNIGTRLFNIFLQAGFSFPDCRVEYPIGGGPDSPFYELVAESFRSILPRAEALGLIRGDQIDVDTLTERLKEEAVSRRSCCAAPLMVGCFARKP
jgi:SAM-dependent methyltransferase